MPAKKKVDRRIPDPRLEKLVNDMDTVQLKLETNTAFTQKALERADAAAVKAEEMAGDVRDIKDIVRSFKLLGVVAGWAAGLVAAVVAIKTGWTSFFGK